MLFRTWHMSYPCCMRIPCSMLWQQEIFIIVAEQKAFCRSGVSIAMQIWMQKRKRLHWKQRQCCELKEWWVSNFPSSLTRNITYSNEEFYFSSLTQMKDYWILSPTSLLYFLGELLFELGSESRHKTETKIVCIGAVTLCAICSATCNATLKNIFVAVAEVGCYTVQRNLSNLQRFIPRKPCDIRYWRAGVGGRSDLQRHQRALGENCAASCWRGVTLCNGSCKLLRLLRKVELDSSSCNVARNDKRCVASCRGTLLHRAILQQLATQRCCVASCCKNCAL